MKHRRHCLALAVLLLAGNPALQAQELYWAARGLNAGLGGDGVWTDSVLGAPAWSTSSLGVTPTSPAVRWAGHATATFAGVAGLVMLDGDVHTRELRVQRDGYTFSGSGVLHLGTSALAGGITLSPRSTATLDVPVAGEFMANGLSVWSVSGGGLLRMTKAGTTGQRILLGNATLQDMTGTALSKAEVVLTEASSVLDFSAASQHRLSNFGVAAGGVVALGSASVTVDGQATAPRRSTLVSHGALSGTPDSALVLDGAAVSQDWAGDGASLFGSLQLLNGSLLTIEQKASFSLLASRSSSLLVSNGSRLVLADGATLTAYNTPQVIGSGRLDVFRGSRVSVLRGATAGELRVGGEGSSGDIANLEIDGPGSSVMVQDRLLIGGGTNGVVSVAHDGRLSAPVLAFMNSASSLVVNSGAMASIGRFDESASIGNVNVTEGVLNIGGELAAASVLTASSMAQSFAGNLKGFNATLNKLGDGTLTLVPGLGSFFYGQVNVTGGRLLVTGTALSHADVSVSAGAGLGGAGGNLYFQSLAGDFDLRPGSAGARLVLSGLVDDKETTWTGLIEGGDTAVIIGGVSDKHGTQTLRGRAGQTFAARSLAVVGSSVRLSGNAFSFTSTDTRSGSAASSLFADKSSDLTIAAGATVRAGTGVRVQHEAMLAVDGLGSRLEVVPPDAGGISQAFVGAWGGGQLIVRNGASFKVDKLWLGTEADVGGNTSRLEVSAAGQAEIGSLLLSGRVPEIDVRRGQLVLGTVSDEAASTRSILHLSDADPATPALVLGWVNGARVGGDNILSANASDSLSGVPGSIWLRGTGTTTFFAPLGITGRVVVDAGRVEFGTVDTFATVQLDLNAAHVLDLGDLPGGSTLKVGALGGSAALTLPANVATLALGELRSGSARSTGALETDTATLTKLGSGEQVFTGSVRAPRLEVASGRFVIDRGSLTLQSLSVTGDGVLALSDQPGADPATLRTALTIKPAATGGVSLAGTIDGPRGAGGVTFAGLAGTVVNLRNGGRFTGSLVAEGGLRLDLGNTPVATRSLIARDGSVIGFNAASFDATGKTLRTASGGRFDYAGTTLVGGTLRGTGHVTGAGAVLDGSTLAANAGLTATADLTLRNASVFGQLATAAPLAVDGAFIGNGGQLRVAGTASLSDVANLGEIQAQAGARLSLANMLDTGGGGRFTVAPGARVEGGALTLSGLLLNNGAVHSPLTINYGGKAKGAGSFGSVSVNDGGVFSPGNSPAAVQTGAAIFGAGGSYEVEMQDAIGAAGTGFDQWRVSGLATFEAGTTPNSVFTFRLVSLGADGQAGAPQHFDAGHGYHWRVLEAASVQGWTAGEVALDTSAFSAATPGHFSLAWTTLGTGAQALDIVYAPVPEPHALALMLCGLGLLSLRRTRPRE